jgi:hypothetical protein
MDFGGLRPGDKVRVSFPGYWAHGKVVKVAEGSRKWGVPIHYTGPGEAGVVIVGPEKLTFIGRD